MNTEVTNVKSNVPATQGAWGCEDASAKDLVVPRLSLVQATSQASKEGKARAGEIVHSMTAEVFAQKGQEIELLPILTVASWIVSEPQVGQQPKFLRMEPITPANDSDNWKQESFENGKPVLRQKRLSVLVLPVKQLDGFPFFVDFQKTNRKPGQVLSTIIQENAFKNQPACARVVSVGTQLKTREQNSWFIYTVAPKRAATPEEVAACRRWYDVFANKAKMAAMEGGEGVEKTEEVPF